MNELARHKDKKKKMNMEMKGMKSYEEILVYLQMNKR